MRAARSKKPKVGARGSQELAVGRAKANASSGKSALIKGADDGAGSGGRKVSGTKEKSGEAMVHKSLSSGETDAKLTTPPAVGRGASGISAGSAAMSAGGVEKGVAM